MKALGEMIPTRETLLSRLRDPGDQESWREFFNTYWKLIYGSAMKAGLSDAEAQDVVQETMLSVMKSMPTFKYREKNASFKSWLLNLTSWRVGDQLRKRKNQALHAPSRSRRTRTGDRTGTATIERVADPAYANIEDDWDADWNRNLMEQAIERIKARVDAASYQIFDCYVLKEWPVSRVTSAFNISTTKVYVTKHRINSLIRKEVKRLQKEPPLPLDRAGACAGTLSRGRAGAKPDTLSRG